MVSVVFTTGGETDKSTIETLLLPLLVTTARFLALSIATEVGAVPTVTVEPSCAGAVEFPVNWMTVSEFES